MAVDAERARAGAVQVLANELVQSGDDPKKVSTAVYAFGSISGSAELVVGLPIVAGMDAAGCVADRHHMG